MLYPPLLQPAFHVHCISYDTVFTFYSFSSFTKNVLEKKSNRLGENVLNLRRCNFFGYYCVVQILFLFMFTTYKKVAIAYLKKTPILFDSKNGSLQ